MEILALDENGVERHEKATTTMLSRHGARVVLQHTIPVGSEVIVRIPHMQRQQKSRVVWISKSSGDQGPFEAGIELEAAENFWGVQFPPEDWEVPKRVPLAGDQPGQSLSQTIVGDHEQQMVTVSAMLRSLIAVLEEKGIVSPLELAEMLKRIR